VVARLIVVTAKCLLQHHFCGAAVFWSVNAAKMAYPLATVTRLLLRNALYSQFAVHRNQGPIGP